MIGDDKPKLLLCGTGLRIGQMTLETFQSLKSCERIFCVNLPEEVFTQIHAAFGTSEDVTPAYRVGGFVGDEEVLSRIILNWSGKTSLGVLFMGHPLLYSLTTRLIDYCRGHAADFRILSGVSTVDALLSVVEPYLKGKEFVLHGTGLVVHDAPQILLQEVTLDPRYTAIILNLSKLREQWKDEPGIWERFVRQVARHYLPTHPVALVECAAGGADRDRIAQASMKDLPGLGGNVTAHTVMFIPMRPRIDVPL